MAFGAIAQLVARFHGMEEVAGSIPASSTTSTLSRYNFAKLGFCAKVRAKFENARKI